MERVTRVLSRPAWGTQEPGSFSGGGVPGLVALDLASSRRPQNRQCRRRTRGALLELLIGPFPILLGQDVVEGEDNNEVCVPRGVGSASTCEVCWDTITRRR